LLRACYTWGTTQEEALSNIQDAVKCCVEDVMAQGEALPDDVEVIDASVASVTA